jgi:hypothetical protein
MSWVLARNQNLLFAGLSVGDYGVCAEGRRWAARISYDSKKHYLGTFDTKQEAALAYDKEARKCEKAKSLNYESIAAAEDAAAQAQAELATTQPNPEGPEGALEKRKSLPSPGFEEPSAKRRHVSAAEHPAAVDPS